MNSAQKISLVIVDGSSYLFRAYHAMKKTDLKSDNGHPTGAIYGVINMLRKLLVDFNPDLIAIVFDAKGKNFRHDIYSEYKANRPPMDEDLRIQIQPIHDIVRAMGLPLIVIEGVEADDVLGTLAQEATEHELSTIICTGDKDLAQCVNEHVSLHNGMTNKNMDADGVTEKFGVPPELIIDYLALMGDTSDNIPGIPGVGPKTASKWLNEFGSLDQVVAQAASIKGKIGERLRDNIDLLPRSKDLVTIRCNLDLDVHVTELHRQAEDTEALQNLYKEFSFHSWLAELHANERSDLHADSISSIIPETHYETILTKEQLKTWTERIQQADYFAIDTETTSLDSMQAELVGISLALKHGEAAYIPLTHDYEDVPQQLDLEYVLEQLRPLLTAADKTRIGHNLKYDINVLSNYDTLISDPIDDSMLMSYVLNSTASRHNMDTLALNHLNHHTVHYEDIVGKGVKQISFRAVSIDEATKYAAEDADITLRLYHKFQQQLAQDEKLLRLYEEIEVPLVSVLSQIERNGVLLDVDKLKKMSAEFEIEIASIEKSAFQVAGEEFNLGSPKQIQEILYDKFKLPVLKKTPKGQPSTAENVLEKLALDFPLPKLILEYRHLSKLKSTYTDKLPLQVNAKTGRVHTSYHQATTATGRLSSSDPNLQNIPIKTKQGRRIREAFIAPKGYKIISADYSQIELRIMAHLSQDEGMLAAFAANEDIHSTTAAEIFSIDKDSVTSAQRRNAKAVNFGLIYGMSAYGLGQQLGVPQHEAKTYIEKYFERFPKVKDYMDETRNIAKEQGYVETVFGRRLYLPDINSRNVARRQYAERAAINAPMQGTAADIIKLAMIELNQSLAEQNIDAKMIMQVHDELVLEAHENQLEETKNLVRSCMQECTTLSVPLEVDIGVGDNWEEAH